MKHPALFSVFTLFLTFVVNAQNIRRSAECGTFTPVLCAIPEADVQQEHCQTCSFDPSRVFLCPLVAGGYFSYATKSEGGGCPNPFMSMANHHPPACGMRCCRTEHEGAFEEDDPLEAEEPPEKSVQGAAVIGGTTIKPLPRLVFEPTDSTCRFKEITRGQVMNFLAMHNSSFVVVGDSTMRQFYLRMVAMMRGQQRFLDYHLHTHASYKVCREVDFLRLAANNPTGDASPSDAKFLKDQVPAFFQLEVGPGQADAKRILSECSRPPLEMNYIQAPLWTAQQEVIQRYMTGVDPDHKPVLILSVGYWQPGEDVPEGYFNLLEKLKDKVLRVVYISVPVSRVLDTERRAQLQARNDKIKNWVRRHGKEYLFVDFDALVGAKGAPKGTTGSKHFTCWIEWENGVKFPASAAGNPSGTGQLTGKVLKLHTDIEGTCTDEMNRNLWQVVLNALASGAQATNIEPGGG